MIQIELRENENGYTAVENYLYNYNQHHTEEDMIIAIGRSYDGVKYEYSNQFIMLDGYMGLSYEWLTDWWEGEKYIRIIGMKPLSGIQIADGECIYTE